MSRLPRTLLPFIVVLLAAGLLASCGEDDSPSTMDGADTPAVANESEVAGESSKPTAPTAAAIVEGKASTSVFTATPKLRSCMKREGFVEDAPPTGGLVAWRHGTGARVVVGSGPNVTSGIASEIGTARLPANVDGAIVVAAAPALEGAARACLG